MPSYVQQITDSERIAAYRLALDPTVTRSGMRVASTTVSGLHSATFLDWQTNPTIIGIECSEDIRISHTKSNGGNNLASDTGLSQTSYSGLTNSGVFLCSTFDKQFEGHSFIHFIKLDPAFPWLNITTREAVQCEIQFVRVGKAV